MAKVRAIFLSDVHLGTRNCQAERLLAFLHEYESDYLYLLGDIVDLWAMRRTVHWSPAQNTVVQKLLKRARHGVRVVLVPGNHDEALREYEGTTFGDIRIARASTHRGADGRRYLLIHGDTFDAVARYHGLLIVLGEHGYNFMMAMNRLLARARRAFGRPGYWSFAAAIKRNLKQAVAYVHDYEYAVARHAAEAGFDGVICGHIHVAANKTIGRVRYLNCGDWVDNCSAVVEHLDGRIELLGGVRGAVLEAEADLQVPAARPSGLLSAAASRRVARPARAGWPAMRSPARPKRK